MEIRQLKIDELEGLFQLADQFFVDSEFLKDFDRDIFVQSWRGFLNSGNGIIFVMEKDGVFTGAIGALKFPDPNNGRLIASELFWYVDREHRGHGLKLLDAFEAWADSCGCQQKIMVYLADLMPEQVKHIYERKGYKQMEIHYTKEN